MPWFQGLEKAVKECEKNIHNEIPFYRVLLKRKLLDSVKLLSELYEDDKKAEIIVDKISFVVKYRHDAKSAKNLANIFVSNEYKDMMDSLEVNSCNHVTHSIGWGMRKNKEIVDMLIDVYKQDDFKDFSKKYNKKKKNN